MASPIVHALQSRAGLKEVRGDRVREHLAVPLVLGDPAFWPEVLFMRTPRLATHARNRVRLART
jgi:hypothetical protein